MASFVQAGWLSDPGLNLGALIQNQQKTVKCDTRQVLPPSKEPPKNNQQYWEWQNPGIQTKWNKTIKQAIHLMLAYTPTKTKIASFLLLTKQLWKITEFGHLEQLSKLLMGIKYI